MGATNIDFSSDVMARIADLKTEVVEPCGYDNIDKEGVFQLRHYQPLAKQKYTTPLLIVYAFINRPYVLDYQPGTSVIQKYLMAGFDVYMIDWGYPTAADQFLNLDDYVDYIDRSVERIKRNTGVDKINLHGYCLGGTLSVIYTALRQKNIKNIVLQATPIDFHTENIVALWARALDPDTIVDTYHMAPGDFLATGFLLVNPIQFIVGKYAGFLDMVESDEGMSDFLRMDHWIFDSPSIPGETYRQYINQWYHDNLLMKGEFRSLGELVDLRKIEIPVLVLEAKFDHIVPPESQKAVLELVASKDKDVYEVAKGHIGMTTSSSAHKEFWPKVVAWFEKRSEIK